MALSAVARLLLPENTATNVLVREIGIASGTLESWRDDVRRLIVDAAYAVEYAPVKSVSKPASKFIAGLTLQTEQAEWCEGSGTAAETARHTQRLPSATKPEYWT